MLHLFIIFIVVAPEILTKAPSPIVPYTAKDKLCILKTLLHQKSCPLGTTWVKRQHLKWTERLSAVPNFQKL